MEFAETDSLMQTQFTPDDAYYASPYPTTRFGSIPQWAPQFVSAPAGWDITQGDPGIIIAVIDTGVDTGHPDLASKIVGGASFVGSVKDQHGHGTHVAGIAAVTTNNGVGIAGICLRCSIMPVRALDASGSGLLSDVANGIIFAADHGARVINLSVGGPSTSQTLRAAIDYAFNHNALPVAAMGNGYAPEAVEPAYWYHALSVGAVEQSDAKANFSNYGPKTDVVAPGVAVLSTLPTYSVTLSQSYKQGYDALSGTSMATPVVSGIAGLVLSRNPDLTAGQVKGIIEATAGDGKSFSSTTGFGRVNAFKAVAAATQGDTSPPSANIVSPAGGSIVSEVFNLEAAPSDDTGVHHVDFVIGGTQAGMPATQAGGGGKGMDGNSATAWSTQWESTRYWNGPQTVTAVAVDTAGNLNSQEEAFEVRNTYVTKTYTAHLCNPPTSDCPYYFLNRLSVLHTAVANVQVSWNYTSLNGYEGLVWASIFDGWRQQLFYTSGSSIDWFPDIRLRSDSTNSVGAGLTQKVKGNKRAARKRTCR